MSTQPSHNNPMPAEPEMGAASDEPALPVNVFEYEPLARQRMEPALWDFYAGYADDGVTLRACRAAFEHVWLRPRGLVNVRQCDTTTTVLGASVSMPILIAPTAWHTLAHPDGEPATARAAGAAGTLMVVSSEASYPLEATAQAAPGPFWYQLYIDTFDRAAARIRRAEAAGYLAIALTIDLPQVGNREQDRRNRLGALYADRMRSADMPDIPDEEYVGDTLTWETLAWLRSVTTLPIVVKGVLTAEDAALAIEHGAAGIIVSNHGGRQLDGAIPSLAALPEVVAAVAGRAEVYLDGGVRRGTDALKALALGARAVLVGRPILWGLAARGEAGVRHVLSLLHDEFTLAMALSGRRSIAEIDASLVQKATF